VKMIASSPEVVPLPVQRTGREILRDLLEILPRAVEEVLAEEIKPQQAQAAATLARAILALVEQAELEERVSAIEARLQTLPREGRR